MWSGVALVAHLAVRVRHIGIVLCGLKQVVQAGQLALRPTHDAQSLANTLQGILRNAQLLGRVMAFQVEHLQHAWDGDQQHYAGAQAMNI